MYHQQEGVGQWKSTYTVVRDLEVLKKVNQLYSVTACPTV